MTARSPACVQALWNGPLLYLLFTVTDPDVDTASPVDGRRSGVQVFVDQFQNDKFPKFEEDDGYVTVSAAGQQSGNRPNAEPTVLPGALVLAPALLCRGAAH